MASSYHSQHFPNESPAYRDAGNKSPEAEIAQRRKIEQVAALRRKLPLGGELPEDYVFDEGGTDLSDTKTVRKTRLSELLKALTRYLSHAMQNPLGRLARPAGMFQEQDNHG